MLISGLKDELLVVLSWVVVLLLFSGPKYELLVVLYQLDSSCHAASVVLFWFSRKNQKSLSVRKKLQEEWKNWIFELKVFEECHWRSTEAFNSDFRSFWVWFLGENTYLLAFRRLHVISHELCNNFLKVPQLFWAAFRSFSRFLSRKSCDASFTVVLSWNSNEIQQK